ncbi:alpha/beta-hydrolase, partial [Microstroma glucosiphilum]
MTISTVGAARHISPTVISTFFKHYFRQAKKSKEDRRLEATDELLFDEAFHIVKRFISLGTADTVEALQAFTNTRIPSQPFTTLVPTLIPLHSCDQAARALIEYFGEEDLKNVVGGERWWQVRGLNGVEAEWVAMTKDWKHAKVPAAASQENGQDEGEVPVEELDRLRRVMLYLHGGGYYFGSCNTHRYQITRLARKMGGRAFCPNYRKAPGFPWPCPLQDCLAAWFYLTDPPPGAGHKAIDPKNIVLAGDSAGGGMCLAVLGVLRDLGMPMPAGAVLISPWCDMTHSFPSIMQNTDSDIIPPYGFIHKPSTLWPSNNVSPGNQTPKASTDAPGGSPGPEGGATHEPSGPSQPTRNSSEKSSTESTANGGAEQNSGETSAKGQANSRFSGVPPAPHPLQSEPIRVELTGHKDPIELKQQIQLYATNNQLYHPLCSPILQGSLGGLPPLYILAGDGEVLRDEVIMLAHRAARPEKYPLPEHLLAKNGRSRETAERFNSQPTQVHLQVFDYQCHVLTLFSFTTAARFAYRAIASFCKYVTRAETIEAGSWSSSKGSPFPILAQEPSPSSSVFSPLPPKEERSANGKEVSRTISASRPSPLDTTTMGLRTDRTTDSPVTLGVQNDYSGQVPLIRPAYEEHMIRERVDVRGAVRALEPEEELQSIRLFVDHPNLIGSIREGPVRRYLEGQEKWDNRFKKTAKHVEKKRKANEKAAEEMLRRAAEKGLLHRGKTGQVRPRGTSRGQARTRTSGSRRGGDRRRGHRSRSEVAAEEWVEEPPRYGPLDVCLAGETPPPSALAGRRDCDDSLTLLRTSL